MSKEFLSIGLMSGTSMDGIDAALLRTDGHNIVKQISFKSIAYDNLFINKIKKVMTLARELEGLVDGSDDIRALEDELTERHAALVKALLSESAYGPDDIDVIGFHGQTLFHAPHLGRTVQIGRGDILANRCGIDVVNDFRSADVAAGGEGAPLVPIYHHALIRSKDIEGDVAILNLGGVGNVTLISDQGHLLAFDTGPGVALLDDHVRANANMRMDHGGVLALSGLADIELVQNWLKHDFFHMPPPKSLDRDMFSAVDLSHMPLNDALATLATFSALAVVRGLEHGKRRPDRLYVAGGGRLNAAIMQALAEHAPCQIMPIESLGVDGDAVEAEAFAYLAVRHLLGLPISFPTTTKAKRPLCGGRLHSVSR